MRSMILFLMAFTLSACQPTFEWVKPGATNASFNADKAQCLAQSYQYIPTANTPYALGVGTTSPGRMNCTGFGNTLNCTSYAGGYKPPPVVTLDANTGARNQYFVACMQGLGYSQRAISSKKVTGGSGRTVAPQSSGTNSQDCLAVGEYSPNSSIVYDQVNCGQENGTSTAPGTAAQGQTSFPQPEFKGNAKLSGECAHPADCSAGEICLAGSDNVLKCVSGIDDPRLSMGGRPATPVPQQQSVIGESALTVEQLATAQGCALDGAAKLLSSEYSEELYKVSCTNSDSLIFRCIYRNCERLR